MTRGHGEGGEGQFAPPSKDQGGRPEIRAKIIDAGQDAIQELASLKAHPDIAGSELAPMLDDIVSNLTEMREKMGEEIRALQMQPSRTEEQERRLKGLVATLERFRALKRLDHIKKALNTAPAFFVGREGRHQLESGPHYEEEDVIRLGLGLGTLALRPDLLKKHFEQHPEALQSGRTADEAVAEYGSNYRSALKEWRQAKVRVQLDNLTFRRTAEESPREAEEAPTVED